MDSRKRDKFILAIKRCIENTFSESEWEELGYLTGGKEVIYNHPRLLRSLAFGDGDYGGNILDVVEQLIEIDPNNLQVIQDFIGLHNWLRDNDPRYYEEFYGHSNTHLATVERLSIRSSFELDQHISRIRGSVEKDPELAIGLMVQEKRTVA
ncbi:MAG: hypothetical protein ACLPVO_01250 [Desulfomonilaceae bacterium]